MARKTGEGNSRQEANWKQPDGHEAAPVTPSNPKQGVRHECNRSVVPGLVKPAVGGRVVPRVDPSQTVATGGFASGR
jgi:hypothetical protein